MRAPVALPSAVVAATLFAACAVRPAWAARPLVTDDARIVDPMSCQVESWLRRARGGAGETWALPGCNPFGNFELTAGGSRVHAPGVPPQGEGVVQAKGLWRRLDHEGQWAWGTAIGALTHSAGPADPYVYVPLTIEAGSSAIVHLNAGLRRERSQRATTALLGFGLEWTLRPATWFVGETFVQDRGSPAWQAGVRHWLVQDRIQVDATIGDRFGSGGRELAFTLGLRILSPAFLP